MGDGYGDLVYNDDFCQYCGKPCTTYLPVNLCRECLNTVAGDPGYVDRREAQAEYEASFQEFYSVVCG